jgi:ribonuclease HII
LSRPEQFDLFVDCDGFPSLRWEQLAHKSGYKLPAGIDEAGRGPLAGPVVVAAVRLGERFNISGINDSKKLTPKKRALLAERINNEAEAVAIAMRGPEIIDRLNILQATMEAMAEAALACGADYILVDGNCFPPVNLSGKALIKGDSLSVSIAAASIVAKVRRDEIMIKLDEEYPAYGFARHKGYGTAAHLQALRENGPCPEHRKSFQPIRSMCEDNKDGKSRMLF